MDAGLDDPSFKVVEITDPGRMGQFGALLDSAFGVPDGAHYLDDFPIWAIPSPFQRGLSRWGAVSDSGRLVATAGARIASLRFENGTMPVALIGAVATDEAFRGKGLASLLVSRSLEWARSSGAVAALLWGSEHALYERLGFALCGEQWVVPLPSIDLPASPSEKIGTGWRSAIFGLLAARDRGLELDASDRGWIEAHQNVEWFWIGSPDEPRAYAAVGRGIDLAGMIHEWGGETQALQELLARLRAARPGLALMGPPALLKEKGLLSAVVRREYLFLAQILDPVRAVQLALGGAPGGSDAAVVVKPGSDGSTWLSIAGKTARCLSRQDLSRLFFGVPLEAGAEKPFPISTWIWGLDAV